MTKLLASLISPRPSTLGRGERSEGLAVCRASKILAVWLMTFAFVLDARAQDAAPVNLGLKYAQRDAQRATEASQAAATRAAAELAKLQAAEKAIVDSQAAKV